MAFESNLRTVLRSYDTWEAKALKAIGYFIEGQAKLRCPVSKNIDKRTGVGGNLRSSIGHKVNERKHAVYLGTNTEYAIFVEKGTGPHIIRPKNARVLAWNDKSGAHFARRVNHPGTKAQPFLTPAVEENKKKIAIIVDRVRFGKGPL